MPPLGPSTVFSLLYKIPAYTFFIDIPNAKVTE